MYLDPLQCSECLNRLLFFSSLCVHSRALVSASSSRPHYRPRPLFSLANPSTPYVSEHFGSLDVHMQGPQCFVKLLH
jgi:hypothetical protein